MKALKLGMVVCQAHVNPTAHGAERRGVVTPASWMHGGADGRVVIRHSAGVNTINPNPRNWQLVPPEQQTTEERVRSTLWSWEPVDLDGTDAGEMPWALMCSLLTPTERDEVFPDNGDWPINYDELAVAIAQVLDHREAAREATFS